MSQQPTLYWNLVSPFARSAKIVIDLGKIPCKLSVVNMFKLEQKKEAYLKINPIGEIPALQLADGSVITQSSAIMVYLCEKYESVPKSLIGETLEKKAQVMKWLFWGNSSFSLQTGRYWALYKNIGMRERRPIPADLLKQAEISMKQGLQTLDTLIGDRQYLANDCLTIADIFIYQMIISLSYVGKDHYSYPNISRWFKKIYAVPEIKAITHQCFPLAKQIAEIVAQIPVEPSKGSL